ncbi:MAG: NAD(P)H-hydrate dehydratase, partial [Chthoniobacterales bacterium]
IYDTVASAAPAEVMVKPITSYRALLDEPIDVWAIGPGLGPEKSAQIRHLIKQAKQPMVVDADALNAAAKNPALLQHCAGPRLLTPHPGEMKRLFPTKQATRAAIASRFCAKYPVTLLFKGSRTIVAEHGRPASYNTTGNPGMATGGMGDVLTGVCAALLAQGLSPFDAARLGAWVCGRAAEIPVFNQTASEESLLPTDLLNHLGPAFHDLRAG